MALVSDLMVRDVTTVTPDLPVGDILRLWQRTHLGAFPVVEGAKVVGIVTEGDLLFREGPIRPPAVLALFDALIPIGGGRRLEKDVRKHVGFRAREVMSSPAVTVGPDLEAGAAARLMVDRRIKHLPVVDASGALLGILSRHDLVRHLAESLPE